MSFSLIELVQWLSPENYEGRSCAVFGSRAPAFGVLLVRFFEKQTAEGVTTVEMAAGVLERVLRRVGDPEKERRKQSRRKKKGLVSE
jgi:hypothetical protein